MFNSNGVPALISCWYVTSTPPLLIFDPADSGYRIHAPPRSEAHPQFERKAKPRPAFDLIRLVGILRRIVFALSRNSSRTTHISIRSGWTPHT